MESGAGRSRDVGGGARGGGRSDDGAGVTSLQLVRAGERLAEAAAALGLRSPSFRSPPRVPGASRTIRRRRDGSAVVAVARRDRCLPAVLADLVEGVVTANDLVGPDAARARDALWAAVATQAQEALAAA